MYLPQTNNTKAVAEFIYQSAAFENADSTASSQLLMGDRCKRQLIDSAPSIGLLANLPTIRQQYRFQQQFRLIAMDGV